MKTRGTKLAAVTQTVEHLNTASHVAESEFILDITHDMTSLIETIRDPNDPTRLLFLLWRDGKTLIVSHLQKGGKVYTPAETKFSAHGDLRLPDRILPYGDLQKVLTELNIAICRFIDLSKDDALLVSLYILSTWFPDCLKAVPYLWIIAALGSGKTTLLKFLHCVCRRAVLIGDVRPASLYKLPSLLCPTLLLDELEPDGSRMGSELRRLLRIGNTQGVSAARNGQLFQTFCSKVIASREPPPDVALASRTIVIRLLPTQRELLPLDESNMEKIAREFQPKLLMFRLENYRSVKQSQVPFEKLRELTPRMRDLALGMAAPVLGQPNLEDKLISILREYDHEGRIERCLEPEWLVIEALFASWHKDMKFGNSSLHVLVGGVSSQINKSLEFRGEDFRLTARRVGGVLKGLGIRTRRLGNLGRGLTFTFAFGRKLHELAQRFGFDRADITTLAALESGYGGAPCTLCEETGLTAGLRFVDLQTRPHLKFRRDQRLQQLNQTAAADLEQLARLDAGDEKATRRT